ncbi:DUF2721 domain-containing protein [Ramlibacter solisilvae]|uniref:Candidate membrane protein n=1 Tax=Ramlibacter tataouinensis TaxID=94132 RepID=A0A127JW90_9BURK|nr:DUF2721 domain-containing protein [Ramlibacter tataouinensis]AMO24143.1 hypothetical protein UC35_16465 [Ramlibacter tataouinensis]
MAASPDGFTDIAKAIQLALAPVFLLTGIAGLLNVMAGRLSRIIDRGRQLTEGVPGLPAGEPKSLTREQQVLEQRRHLTSVAITACTISALLVCVVIAAIFVEAMLAAPLNWVIGGLFTLAMLALVVGLAYFLREVHLAMKSIRIRLPAAK